MFTATARRGAKGSGYICASGIAALFWGDSCGWRLVVNESRDFKENKIDDGNDCPMVSDDFRCNSRSTSTAIASKINRLHRVKSESRAMTIKRTTIT